jgi:hypothetical protein
MQASNHQTAVWRGTTIAPKANRELESITMSSQSSDENRPYYDTSMPAPVIPTRKTPWFMKALWALALLLVVGLVYSFWRISTVPSPRLEVPRTQSTDTPNQR